MRILVLSDSHSSLRSMRVAITALQPDAVVHLGDHYDDAVAMSEEFPHIPFHMVPGNCDRYRTPPGVHEILCYDVCGVRLYMTHGHLHGVKMTMGRLLRDARMADAAAVLYGHTHCADCHQEADGLWVMNPGASNGSVGLITTDENRIHTCCVLQQSDLEEWK